MHIKNFKPEDFLNQSYEPYLFKRESTNLLNTMLSEKTSRVAVAKSFIDCLKNKGKRCICTEFHLSWIMECLGYAFSMPIQEAATISTATKIYRKWLIDPASWPEPFKNKQGYYQREILCHLSIIFQKKKEPEKHSELCNDVLKTFKAFIRAQSIDRKTWECLIQLLLLVANHVLTNYTKFTEYVSSKVLKLFFEAWLRSNCHNDGLWRQAKQGLNLWFDHESVIIHWTAVILGLTKSVTGLMNGDHPTSCEIIFGADCKSSNVAEVIYIYLTEKQIIYFWYRFTEVVLETAKKPVKMIPGLHCALVKSVSSIVDCFLSICMKKVQTKSFNLLKLVQKPDVYRIPECIANLYDAHYNYMLGVNRLPMPSIDSILDIFGEWLFDHAQIDPIFDAVGKSEAISALCRVFSRAQAPVCDGYLGKFFTILLQGIASSDQRVITEIIKNSTELLSLGISAVDFFLRPDGYIPHLALYLCDKDTEASIRMPCYTILSMISTLPNVCKIKQTSKHILDIFLSALGLETENDNFFVLIWSMVTFASTINEDHDALQSILCAMIDRLGTIDFKEVNERRMYCNMLEVIRVLPHLINRNIVGPQIMKRNLSKICTFIPKRGKSTEFDQSTGLLLALDSWLACFPNSFSDYEVRLNVIKILQNRTHIEKFKSFGESMLSNIFNNLKREEGYGINLALTIPANASDEDKKHFRIGGSLLSFYEKTRENGVVIRNASGIYSWKLRMMLTNAGEKQKLHLLTLPSNNTIREYSTNNSQLTKMLLDDLDEQQRYAFVMQDKIFNNQKNIETKVRSRNIPEYTKELDRAEENAKTCHRSFLGQIGFLELENLKEVTSLPSSTFAEVSEKVDQACEKEIIVFPLLFLATAEDDESTIFNLSNSYTKEFTEFLSGLGSKLEMRDLQLAHIKSLVARYDCLLYKNCELFESVCISPSFFTSENKAYNFTSLLDDFPVLVVWNSRLKDIHSKRIPSIISELELDKTTVLLLSALSSNFTQINVLGNRKKSGPLIDKMVIPNIILPKLLLFTLFNYRSSRSGYAKLWEQRSEIIRKSGHAVSSNEITVNHLFN